MHANYEKTDPSLWRGKQIWPVYIYSAHNEVTKTFGGIEFDNVYVADDFDRSVLVFMENGTNLGIEDVFGTIYVDSPCEPSFWLGKNIRNVDLTVKKSCY